MSLRSPGDGGLVWAIGASGVAHVAAIAALVLAPSRFEGMAPAPESYTVSLVAPSVVGGTHLPGPRPKELQAPDKVELPAPAPAPAKVAPPPKEVPKPETDAAPEPPQVAAKQAPKLPPPAEQKPEQTEAKKMPEAEPKDSSVAAVKKPEPVGEPEVEVPLRPDEKKSPAKDVPPAEVEKKEPKKEPAKTEVTKSEPPKKEMKPEKKQTSSSEVKSEKPEAKPSGRDEQIAAAIQRRAEAARAESATDAGKDDVDSRIAAAVQRRAKEAARAASGIGSSDASVASVGPGSGVGGVVRGIEYVMYRNQMESRIKAAWAWAGSDRSLRAVVRFNVTEEGRIINVQTMQPSGDPSYDASVERAVRAADPLGPPPEQYRDEFGTVELEFRAEDARG